jgi:hypothetical protein
MALPKDPKPEDKDHQSLEPQAKPSLIEKTLAGQTTIEPGEVLPPVQPAREIMDVLEENPELKEINDKLGTQIGKLAYNEYRHLVGILEQLREEEYDEAIQRRMGQRFGAEPKPVAPSLAFPNNLEANNGPRAQTKMQRLISFVENSVDEGLRNLKPLLEAHRKFHDHDAMTQLILLTRLYYLRGVNIINPENDPEKPRGLKIADDEEISLSVGSRETPIIRFSKTGDDISVRYSDLNRRTKILQLQPGKVYIFGRMGENLFTVKNCEKNIHSTLSEQGGIPVPGVLTDRKISRASIGVEIKDGEIIIYDRASKNTLILDSTKFPTGESVIVYNSAPFHEAETVVLGSTVFHPSFRPSDTAIIADDKRIK